MKNNRIRLFALLFILGVLIQLGVSFFIKSDPQIKPVPVEIDFKPSEEFKSTDLVDTSEVIDVAKEVK